MCQYQFYTTKYQQVLEEKINDLVVEEDAHLDIEKEKGSYKIVYELPAETLNAEEKCNEFIAHVMSDIIQKQAIIKICQDFFKEITEIATIDQIEITDAFLCKNYLSRQEGFSYVTYYLLYLPILYEIRRYKGFNIDGWINFRIEKYQMMLRELLIQFTEEYLSKREVVEFVNLLRTASLLSIPLEEELHVIYFSEERILLYNKAHHNITSEYIRKYCKDLILDHALKPEDFILHILITVNPAKVFVHHKNRIKNKSLLSTLEIIFDTHLIYCESCEFCKSIE